MSKIDPMKMPSGYNIAKIGSRLKWFDIFYN